MQKKLFLVCPTDCLEHVVNTKFNSENYFYTSLGNSLNYQSQNPEAFIKTIEKLEITQIHLVLASDNMIIKDAIQQQEHKHIKDLEQLYSKINLQNKKHIYTPSIKTHQILSNLLHQIIEEIIIKLEATKKTYKVSGKIYDRNKKRFTPIYNNLHQLQKHQLN